MCTKIDDIHKMPGRCFGYKVVRLTSDNPPVATSPTYRHVFTVGKNFAIREWSYTRRIPNNPGIVEDGFFHLCTSLRQARKLLKWFVKESNCTFAIIKVRFKKIKTYSGTNYNSFDSIEGESAIIATEVTWDGTIIERSHDENDLE